MKDYQSKYVEARDTISDLKLQITDLQAELKLIASELTKVAEDTDTYEHRDCQRAMTTCWDIVDRIERRFPKRVTNA